MNPKNLLLVVFLSVQSIFPLFPAAQEVIVAGIGGEKMFTVEQLKADLSVLRKSLEEGHAGLYRYTPKEELDKMFNEIENSLIKPLSEIEFLMKLKPLIAKINCGHTSIVLSTDGNAELSAKYIIIPFSFRIIDNKAYLFRNYSDNESLKMGGEVISINGNSMNDILEKMLPLISGDAHVQTGKYRQLERTSGFSQLYDFLYGASTSLRIKYISPDDKKEISIEVKGITSSDVSAINQKRYPDTVRDFPPISLEYNGEIPILTIRTFNSGSYSEQTFYSDFIKKAFVEFNEKGVKNLIIDLRDNGGGDDDYGKILASYLLDKPFDYYNALEMKKDNFDFYQYTDIPAADRKIPESAIRKNTRGWYDFLDHPNVGRQNNQEPTFKGQAYILINGSSFSTTGECTSIIHYHKKAKFVGEECGAGYYGNNSGIMPQITLSNTKLRIRIPLWMYTMAVDGYPTDRGIIPDYPVSPKIEDLLVGKDTQMEYILNLIRNIK